MKPELLRSTWLSQLGISLPSYFVLLATGLVLAVVVATLASRKEGLDPDAMVDTSVAMIIAGVFGARLLHVIADGYFWDYVHLCTDPSLVDWHITQQQCLDREAGYRGVWDAAKMVCHPSTTDCFAWAKFWSGGLAFYGGLIAAWIVGVILFRRERFPFFRAADWAGGVGVPLGLAFGRMGCLLAGCCFGARCDLPWALRFPHHSPASEAQHAASELLSAKLPSLPVHPTQVYESIGALAICAFCWLWLSPRKRYDGQVLAVSLALYAVLRFVLEYLRRDDRGGLLGLSTSQLIGLGMLGAAAAIHYLRRHVHSAAAAHAS